MSCVSYGVFTILMNSQIRIILLIAIGLFLSMGIAQAYDVKDALNEAYQRGYEKGFADGRNNGGSEGYVDSDELDDIDELDGSEESSF